MVQASGHKIPLKTNIEAGVTGLTLVILLLLFEFTKRKLR
jgi:hypothetical protein